MRRGSIAGFLVAVVLFVAPGWVAAKLQGDRVGMRNARYCEIFVIRRHLLSADAQVFNTLGLNDCPAALWTKLEASVLKKQLRATAVIMNGPRYFMMDASSFEVPGEKAAFDGLEMRLVAHIALPRGSLLPWHKREPYTETTIRRTTRWVYYAGRPTYRLAAPGGKSYVLQSYAQIVDPHQTEASLASLATRLKLPAGWSFRSVSPQTTLTLQTVDGTAHIIQDDFENTYQRVNPVPL